MKHKKEKKRRSPSTSSSSSDEHSDEWVEKSLSAAGPVNSQPTAAVASNPLEHESSLGASFLDLVLSNSSSREKKEKVIPINKQQPLVLPIGIYYPNKKETSTTSSRGEQHDRFVDTHKKDKFSEKRSSNRQFQKPSSDDEYRSSHGRQRGKSKIGGDLSSSRHRKYSSSDDEVVESKYKDRRDDKYKRHEKDSRKFQKPNSSGDEYDSHRRHSSKGEKSKSKSFQKPNSSDEEYDSHRRYSIKSEKSKTKSFQKPKSSDEEYDSHRRYSSKSEKSKSKSFQKPKSSDEEYDSHVRYSNKIEKSKSKSFQKPNSSGEEYDSHRSHSRKGEKSKSKAFQKPNSSDEEYDSHRRYSSKSDKSKKKSFQKPNGSDEEYDSHRRYSSKSDKSKKKSFQKPNGSDEETKLIRRESCETSLQRPEQEERRDEAPSGNISSSQNVPITLNDLNQIAAQMIKAEIMGDTELVMKLQVKLDAAKAQKVAMPGGSKPYVEKDKNQVIVVNEYNMKDKRRRELLERKKLAFLGDNDDRWVVEGKSFPNIGDEYEEEENNPRKRKKQKTDHSEANTIQQHKRTAHILNTCAYCLSSTSKQHPVVIDRYSEHVYLAIPDREPLVPLQCLIVTTEHIASLRATDTNSYQSVRALCEKLVSVFSQQGKTCIFFEMVSSLQRNHCHVHCVPLDREVGDMAPLYFQKAISDLEADTRHNKTLTKIERNKLCTSIPNEMEYFYVNFDWDKGFAHVIENRMSQTFAEEIIGGMLDLSPSQWRHPAPLSYEGQMKQKLNFLNFYRK